MYLIYFLRVLLRKSWIILSVAAIAGATTFFITKDLEKKYKSTAQLATGFTTNRKVEIVSENMDYWKSRANFENLIETMKSDLVSSMVCYNLLLHDLQSPEPFRKKGEVAFKDSVAATLKRKLASFELLSSYNEFESYIVETMHQRGYSFGAWVKSGDMKIGRVNDTDFVRVEFQSENPFLSAFVVNNLCEEYIRYTNRLNSSFNAEAMAFFSNEVEKKKQELETKTEMLNNYRSDHQVYNYERESTAKLTQLSDYELQLQEEESKANGIVISLKNLKTAIDGYSKNSADNSKLLELRTKINDLSRIYRDGGSKDTQLASTIEGLRDQLQVEMQRVDLETRKTGIGSKSLSELNSEKDLLTMELEIVNSNIAATRDKINNLKGNISRIGSKESTLASLESERDNALKDYNNAVDRYNEAKSKSMISSTGLQLIIKGQPNPDAEPSKAMIIVALSVIGSMAICVAVIFMLEYFDYRIRTPYKFESLTKIKLMGHVSEMDGKNLALGLQFGVKSEREDVEAFKHSIRKIRMAVESSGKSVILISSPEKNQGKTFFIMSLAQSLSLINKRILIIDTNFKNNALTKLLVARPMLQQVSSDRLLNNGAEFREEEPEQKNHIISFTRDKNIDIIGSSQGLESPSEIFAGKDFVRMLQALKNDYDYILMEGAALNDYSDTQELMKYVEGVVAIFSAKSTINQQSRESIKYLKALNGKFIGAILNRVNKNDLAI